MLSSCVQILRHSKASQFLVFQEKFIAPVGNAFVNVKRKNHTRSNCVQNQKTTFLRAEHKRLLGPALSFASVRYASIDSANIAAGSESILSKNSPIAVESTAGKTLIDLPDIPQAPPVTSTGTIEEIGAQILNAAGEPSFASIGLGGWTPVGLIQNCMEFLHVSCDIPWWGAIAIGTLAVRTIIFPLVIMAQRNAAKMNNNLPQMQVLQMKMTEARQSGNAMDSARYAQEMVLFMKEKEMNPLKNLIVPLAQAPLFISFFMGLRGMANAPVDSMREGGLFWFTDLTMSDPTFLLPIITSATLYLTIEIGTDSARLSAQNMMVMKYVLRALPLIIFPFTMNFPAAILTYWACSNFISLAQVSFLRIPAVRDYFKIDKLITHNPNSLPSKKKGFVKGMQESWQNMKITKEIEERQRLDEIRFSKAGRGPLVKTFKYDPTKQQPPGSTATPPTSQMAAKNK